MRVNIFPRVHSVFVDKTYFELCKPQKLFLVSGSYLSIFEFFAVFSNR